MSNIHNIIPCIFFIDNFSCFYLANSYGGNLHGKTSKLFLVRVDYNEICFLLIFSGFISRFYAR